ncbi:hypothetical protein F5148DRAFT_874432 [Russula earlei]|uniref:Uncharacterized protein n=1 Tax=Russula earlei TaxID=71964 RepID=A0ACC0UAM3_9AGAM|nr:hypothetical protein F5148DRAFT_874432 [Russula earlei]
MDQHHRSRSSSRSELPNRPPSICVSPGPPHKAHSSLLSPSPRAPPSPSSPAYPPSYNHTHPAITSTPQTNEANALFPPHYITSSLATPHRSSSVLLSPFFTPPSPALPALLTMSPQVLAPSPAPLHPPSHGQQRPSSRSERLLRETLRRDRAASLSPRSRIPRAESRSARIASTSGEMFHCACTESDDEDDQPNHSSLLFAQLPQHRQRPMPPFQHPSTSSADVQSLIHHESGLKEKLPIVPLCHSNSPYRSAAPQNPFESYLCSTAAAQKHDRQADHESTWSSTESSSLPSPTPNHQPLTPSPSPSPPSYTILPESLSHMATTRGRTRNHTHPMTAVPLPTRPHQTQQSQPQSHWQRQQVTPPPTPPTFDARGASARLRTIDGYVSFANVEGLGGPPGTEEEALEDERRGGLWWPWRDRSRSGILGPH